MLEISTGTSGPQAGSVVVAEPDAKFIIVPDATLLFTADFKRAGPDLVLTGEDGRHALVQDYFKTDKPLPLYAPNGAGLQPDVVELLADGHAHSHYAQAGAAAAAAPIGSVKTLIGSVTAVRNGVEITLKVGDPIYKSDVVQTAGGSAVGISFPDGTALHITGNARMALSDYSFDPSSTTNGAFFHLIDGTFSFVAGQVARTGGLKIETPVGTVGIRGTTGWVQQVATVSATLGNVSYSFAVVDDQGTDHSGIYDVLDQNGNVIATVSNKGILTLITGQGPGQAASVTTQAMTAEQLAFEQQIIQGVFNAVGAQGLSPRSDPGHNGSYQSPPTFEQHNELFPGDHSTTFALTLPGNNGPVTGTVTIVFTPPVLPVVQKLTADVINHAPILDQATLASTRTNDTSPSGQSVGTIFSGKFHDADTGASLAGIAVAGNTANPGTQGVWQYSINGAIWIDIGAVSAAAALVFGADTLIRFVPVQNFYGDPPSLLVYGLDNSYAGGFTGVLQVEIDATSGGGSSPVSATPVQLGTSVDANVWVRTDGGDPAGGDWSTAGNWTDGIPGQPEVVIIDLPAGQTVLFEGGSSPTTATIGKLVNAGGGTLDVGHRAILKVEGPTTNDGEIRASHGGEVSFDGGTIDNTHDGANDGVIDASGRHSVVELSDAHVIGGTLQTEHGGVIRVETGTAASGTVFDGAQTDDNGCLLAVTIDGHVIITEDATLTLRGAIHNHGTIEVDPLSGPSAHLAIDGIVKLDGCGTVQLDGRSDSIIGSVNSGHNVLINADNIIHGGGSIGDGGLHDLKLVNQSGGVIDADDRAASLTIDTGSHHIVNTGVLEATHGGTLIIDSDVSNDCGLVEAGAHSYVTIGGDISSGDALIKGGTLEYDGCSNVDTAFACNSAGTLVLGADSHFTGTVSGFDADDRIDFKGIDFTNCTHVVYCDGTLTVFNGSESSSIQLDGDYSNTHFVVFSDGCGDAEVATAPQANDDHVIASFSALDCSSLTLPSEVLLSNDSDAIRGDDLSIRHATSGDGTCVSGPDCNGDITVRFDNAGDGGSFGYTTRDSYHLSSNACVDVSFQCGSLEGTCANEIILPGSQSACLTGGGGNDTFLFENNVATGHYNVTDFTTHSQGGSGADVIDLENFSNISSFHDVLCNAHESGCDTVIDLGCNNTITLANVHIADLSSADFAIHHAASVAAG